MCLRTYNIRISLLIIGLTNAAAYHNLQASSRSAQSASSTSSWYSRINTDSAIFSTPLTSGGLKGVRVNLPSYRTPGEMAQLRCDFDLGNDTLYAVKWYKDNEEFYRFVARERPPATSHRVEGVKVEMAQSDSKKVILPSVDLRTGGLYRCEVSAEAPSFASAQSEARMDVISFPSEDPLITGMQLQYQIGDKLHLNCTSAKSFPATVLHWYINEKHVSSENALVKYPPNQHKDGLLTSVLGLRFSLHQRHFLEGSMRVKCVASLTTQAVVKDILVPDFRETLLLVKNSASFFSSLSIEALTSIFIVSMLMN